MQITERKQVERSHKINCNLCDTLKQSLRLRLRLKILELIFCNAQLPSLFLVGQDYDLGFNFKSFVNLFVLPRPFSLELADASDEVWKPLFFRGKGKVQNQ